MSTQSANSFLNIDENDLNFDLDDDDDEDDDFKVIKNKNDNLKQIQSRKRKSPSPHPLPLSPSIRQQQSKNSCIEIIKINNNSDKTCENRESINKFEINNQSLLELFAEDDKEEDKDIYSSTQLTQKTQANNKTSIFNNEADSIIEKGQVNTTSSDIHQTTKLIDKIYAQNLNHDKIWLFAKDSIIEQLTIHNLSHSLIDKYSIKNCLNKVFLLVGNNLYIEFMNY